MTTEPLVRLDGVMVHFGGVKAVDGVTFTLERGSLCGVVGPNGSGKTTLINAMSGISPATGGRIEFLGSDTTRSSPFALARLGLRRTFQSIRLLPELDVLANVALGADSGGGQYDGLLRPRRSRTNERRTREQALAALDRVGLVHLARHRPTDLPYGHQRMIEIARAVVSEPEVLLLDEPVAGMSGEERRQVADLLISLRADGMTQMLVEHDLGLVTRICDHLVALDHGQVIADGDPLTVMNDSSVREAYLGPQHTSA
ncbi:ABC transporter ATP-binding protein [Aeromicrobium chenweiae]|uniref:ABC transporter ATP-binding protein n=1 Tax=Aeromicrobium chenweiae TaxID=2079793 RepID=A0A2S0WIV4_9ACTN|nr:ABC transporter ATP-binding protein [Aeromicrobium chenweiae]AWB91265.1 ABC transporter ATP-binding protein [Aeromicrobium chenweiae]TGN31783.1 ABC transporter ATP-binding protein [Aeromicrobium chenweiae]